MGRKIENIKTSIPTDVSVVDFLIFHDEFVTKLISEKIGVSGHLIELTPCKLNDMATSAIVSSETFLSARTPDDYN